MGFSPEKDYAICQGHDTRRVGNKKQVPFLQKTVRPEVYKHIIDNAKIKSLYIDCLNGAEDHIHILMGLNADISISKTIQLLKGESSFWINKQSLMKTKFEWADEYYAVSVSESQLQKVRDYIAMQEQHHQRRTFQEECDEFMKHYDFTKFQG